MRIGFSLPALASIPIEPGKMDGIWRVRFARGYEICEIAEDLGFDFATIGHHRFDREIIYVSSPLTVLAALAARTKRLRFGTNIAILPLMDPVEFAEQAATLDEISDGRLFLGLGIGYRPYEFEMIGLNFKDRVSRMEEGVEILRRCWSDEPVHFNGKHFQINGATVMPKPVQRPGPPIFIGGYVEAAIIRAGRLGDGWLTDNTSSIGLMVPQIARYREEASKAGRAGMVSLNRKVGIAPTRREVEEKWLPEIIAAYRGYVSHGLPIADKKFEAKLKSGDSMSLSDIPPDLFIAGSPEDCVEAIRSMQRLSNCDYIVADFDTGAGGADYETIRRAIALFGEKVLPAFHDQP
jgi:probable F420-dependent oxidoreductase